ncbi:MAG: type II secretion system F family protein [Clostridia bacterium]|nr:type II secretion system F family protein [Clostridia bacterium]
MQKYKYVAVNLQKQKIKGTFIANDEKDLAAQLAKQSLYLISAKPYSGNTPSAFFTLGTGKVNLKELTNFCRQFSIMINTHIPILDCIDILKNQQYSAYFRGILEVIYEDVKSGIVLSAALEKHAKVFPDFFRSMVYVGEQSGKLENVFIALAEYYETDAGIKRKVKSALSYPIMLLCMAVGIVILMLAFVIPTFRETLSQLEVEVSGLTKAVYDMSDFLLANWLYLLAGAILIALAIFGILQTEKGKYGLDYLKVKIPLIKRVQINTITARFARGFSLLLSSGMDLTEAMDSIEVVLGNRYVKQRFHAAADSVRQGMSLTNAFETYKLFPSMMNQMITVGEKTNSLDEVLTRSCVFFDSQVETALNSVTSKIQPVMLVLIGGVIAVMFLAVYSPMLSIMTGLGV